MQRHEVRRPQRLLLMSDSDWAPSTDLSLVLHRLLAGPRGDLDSDSALLLKAFALAFIIHLHRKRHPANHRGRRWILTRPSIMGRSSTF